MATSKTNPANTSDDQDSTRPGSARVPTSVPPGAPGTSLEDAVESGVEKAIKEYGPPVVTAVLVVVVAMAASAFYFSRREATVSNQWDSINVGLRSSSVSTLQGTADSARGTFVGAVATQAAGMTELNAALEKMVRDSAKAKEEIKSAMERFKQVVDYPYANDLLRQQAKYALAFSHEAVGEFDAALKLYQEVSEIEGSPLVRLAKDGALRCQDENIRSFQEKFAAWKPSESGPAPDLQNLQNLLNQDGQLNLDALKNLNIDAPPGLPGQTPPATTEGGENQAPPAEAPPAEAPPTEAPPAEAPPTEGGESQAPPAEAPPAETPPGQAPPTENQGGGESNGG